MNFKNSEQLLSKNIQEDIEAQKDTYTRSFHTLIWFDLIRQLKISQIGLVWIFDILKKT